MPRTAALTDRSRHKRCDASCRAGACRHVGRRAHRCPWLRRPSWRLSERRHPPALLGAALCSSGHGRLGLPQGSPRHRHGDDPEIDWAGAGPSHHHTSPLRIALQPRSAWRCPGGSPAGISSSLSGSTFSWEAAGHQFRAAWPAFRYAVATLRIGTRKLQINAVTTSQTRLTLRFPAPVSAPISGLLADLPVRRGYAQTPHQKV